MIDWSRCPEVERNPGKLSGAWVVRGTRIPAEAIVANADDGYSAEQIAADIFEGLRVERARAVIEYARATALRPV